MSLLVEYINNYVPTYIRSVCFDIYFFCIPGPVIGQTLDNSDSEDEDDKARNTIQRKVSVT